MKRSIVYASIQFGKNFPYFLPNEKLPSKRYLILKYITGTKQLKAIKETM